MLLIESCDFTLAIAINFISNLSTCSFTTLQTSRKKKKKVLEIEKKDICGRWDIYTLFFMRHIHIIFHETLFFMRPWEWFKSLQIKDRETENCKFMASVRRQAAEAWLGAAFNLWTRSRLYKHVVCKEIWEVSSQLSKRNFTHLCLLLH